MKIKGIKFTAPVLDYSGYGRASRENIKALHKLGIPITISPVSFEEDKVDLGDDGEFIKSLINRDIEYNINFVQLTPEFWENLKEPDKLNVGYTVWENSKLHPSWSKWINNYDLVFTGSEWGKQVFIDSGVTIPVGVASHCMDVSLLNASDVSDFQISGLDNSTYCFYDIFQWTEKKSPLDALRVYWATFTEKDNVAFVIKTYRSDFSDSEKETIRHTIRKARDWSPLNYYPPVYLLLDKLSEDEIKALHKRGDCLVTLNKGEGVGLVPMQAGAHGNPVIITGWGGVTEYANSTNSYILPYTLEPCFGMRYSPWHRSDQWWAKADLQKASKYMRYVYENRDAAKNVGINIQNDLKKYNNHEYIGKKFIEKIEEIL